MKSIKFYLLGFLGAILLAGGLYACSSEDTANNQKAQSIGNIQAKTNEYAGVVGVISGGIATAQYDESELKKNLIAEGTFAAVESVELTYGINPANNQPEAFLTVVGIESATSANVAVIADLFIIGSQIIIKDPETHPEVYATHTCTGVNCSSCSFTRTGFFGRITGCEPCGKPIVAEQPSGCNHSQTGTGGAGAIIKGLAPLVPIFL